MTANDAGRLIERGRERRAGRSHRTATLAVLALSLAGCSLIGLGIGAIVDSHQSKPRPVEGWDVQRIKKGARIRLLLREGGEVAGRFRGVETLPEEYAGRYASWRAARGAGDTMPALGDRAIVGGQSGATDSGTLVGFDLAAVAVRLGDGAPIQQRRYADVVRFATERGPALSGTQLGALALQGQLPLRSRLIVDDTRVPLEQVARIQVPTHAGKLVGFLLGAAADVIVIVAVASSFRDFGSHICESGCTSCPFVESFDGRRYVLETEAFGGALFPAAQRADWARLDHLAAVDGGYRLRLTNEQEEIQYVDEAHLLVVDGPPGARIVPSLAGRLHALAAPIPPTRATTLRGEVVTRLLAAREGDAWISSPLGRDPESVEDSRDGLIVEFSRPPRASTVTLAFRVQSTPWVSTLLRRVLALHGRSMPAWSARLEADPAARAEFLTALRREGLPAVSVWNGKGWQPVGFLANVGPAALREQAIAVEIGSVPGDILRVRLESGAGTWIVDSVEASYGPEPPLEAVELRPVEARTADGTDIRRLLGSADGARHVMRPHRDAVTLVFAAPPLRPGRRRSLVVKLAGYYTILVPPDGEPQEALFARLVTERGAFARYSLRSLYADLEARRTELERPAPDDAGTASASAVPRGR
jgi:hypothetical protein